MTQPQKPNEPNEPEITLLALSVQQLSAEARSLRESIQQGHSNRETMIIMMLLGVITIAVVALALHILL